VALFVYVLVQRFILFPKKVYINFSWLLLYKCCIVVETTWRWLVWFSSCRCLCRCWCLCPCRCHCRCVRRASVPMSLPVTTSECPCQFVVPVSVPVSLLVPVPVFDLHHHLKELLFKMRHVSVCASMSMCVFDLEVLYMYCTRMMEINGRLIYPFLPPCLCLMRFLRSIMCWW